MENLVFVTCLLGEHGHQNLYKVELPEANDFLQGTEQTKSQPLPEKLNA